MSQPDGTDGDPGFWADFDDFCDEDSGTLTFDYQFWNPATSSWEEIESDSVSVGDHSEGTNWPSTYISGGEWPGRNSDQRLDGRLIGVGGSIKIRPTRRRWLHPRRGRRCPIRGRR